MRVVGTPPFGAMILLLGSSPLWAQDVFESEDLRARDESPFRVKARLTNYFDARVPAQNEKLGVVEEEASFSADA